MGKKKKAGTPNKEPAIFASIVQNSVFFLHFWLWP